MKDPYRNIDELANLVVGLGLDAAKLLCPTAIVLFGPKWLAFPVGLLWLGYLVMLIRKRNAASPPAFLAQGAAFPGPREGEILVVAKAGRGAAARAYQREDQL